LTFGCGSSSFLSADITNFFLSIERWLAFNLQT